MKQEILESYITYIFDFFQKSRCFKAGQGNMLRNFRFAAEKQFTRNQLGILYFLVNTLIDNGYLYLKDRDFIALTENGADVINGGECVIPKISLERTIYEKRPVDQIYMNSFGILSDRTKKMIMRRCM